MMIYFMCDFFNDFCFYFLHILFIFLFICSDQSETKKKKPKYNFVILDFYGLFVLVSQAFLFPFFLLVYYIHFLSAILGNNIYFKSLRKDDEIFFFIFLFFSHHKAQFFLKLICVGLIGFL